MMVNRTKTNLLIISHLHDACSQQVQRLIQIADAAAELRQPDLLLEASSTLYKLGQDEASHFYLALANRRRTGQETPSRAILSDLAERAGNLWRAKALTTLGTLDFHKGNHREATDYYAQARRLSPDPLTFLHTQAMTAQIAGLEGDHRTAVRILSQTLPLASSKGIHGLNHRNSLAVELNELGRVEEARYYLEPCLSSPYRIYYPEWADTATEVYSPSRHRIYIPPAQPDKIARVDTHPMRALMSKITELDKWRDAKKPAEPSPEDYLHSGRFKLYNAATQDDKLTEAQWEALYSIYTKFTEHLPEQTVLDNVLKAVDEELRGVQR